MSEKDNAIVEINENTTYLLNKKIIHRKHLTNLTKDTALPVNCNILRLTDSPGPFSGLCVCTWIPVRIKYHNSIKNSVHN